MSYPGARSRGLALFSWSIELDKEGYLLTPAIINYAIMNKILTISRTYIGR